MTGWLHPFRGVVPYRTLHIEFLVYFRVALLSVGRVVGGRVGGV